MKISLREFQRQGSMYIKSLDKEEIILTQYNLPIAKVVSVDTKSTSTIDTIQYTEEDPSKTPDNFGAAPTSKIETPSENKWITQCEFRACRKDAIGNFKIVTYSTDTGDQTQTQNLCKLHKHLASKEGAVTEV